MYIRRKVYSAVEDENGEIRYFSTNEVINEEEYLEMLYSEAFLDDDDMEKLFSENSERKLSPAAKAGIAAGTTAAGALALHFGGKAAANKVARGFETNALERGLAKWHGVESAGTEKVKGVIKSSAEKVKGGVENAKNKVDSRISANRAKKSGILTAEEFKKELESLDASQIKQYLESGAITEKQANTLLKRLDKAAERTAKAAEREREKARKLVAKNKQRILRARANRAQA